MRPLVELEGVAKKYGTHPALVGVDMSLDCGQIVGLLGENGCGKTTLFKILAGVLAGYEGTALIDGKAPGPQTKALTAYLPDKSFFAPSSKIKDCVEIFEDFFPDFDAEKALETINFFGLKHDKTLAQMSLGMREKVQVAMVMGRRARLYLLDEPISGVDPSARQVILEGIVRNLDPRSLVIISTHLLHDLEPILDTAVFMRAGRVIESGNVDDLRAKHAASLDGIFRKVY